MKETAIGFAGHRARLWGCALLSAAVILGAPAPRAQGQEPDQGATEHASSAQAAAQAALLKASREEPRKSPLEASRIYVEPPDGKWLTDEVGRYFVATIQKGIEGSHWRWIGENRIRIGRGMPLEVVDHDDESFTVKIYEIPDPIQRPPPPPPPTEEDLAAIAANYGPALKSEDRLRFAGFDRGLPRRGQWRNGFDVGDMNGDGHPDIVFGPHRKGKGRPNIFLGDGRGGWRRWAAARYPDLPYDYGDAAVEDFDGDGHPDLALGMHLTGMLVLKNDGAGNFTAWSDGITLMEPARGPGAFSSRDVVATDWNEDGKPDLVAIGEGMSRVRMQRQSYQTFSPEAAVGVLAYLNQGDGTWRAEPVSTEGFGDSVAIGDFNGDGHSDVVTASGLVGGKRILFLGTEGGTWEPAYLDSLPPRAWIRTVATAELDGDGIDDILVGFANRDDDEVWRTGVDLYYGARDGEFKRRTLYAREGSREGIYSLATGDLDGDGRLDVAAVTGNGEPWVFLGDGDGFFVHEDSPELPRPVPGCAGYALGLVDLDGDDRDEMVIGLAGESEGYVGFTGQPGCPGEGSLRAWRTLEPRPPGSAESGSAAGSAPPRPRSQEP